MKKFYATHLVKSEDLNHHGTLFAARTASWFVESAFAAAACEHGDSSEILCRNVHGMSFDKPIHNGSVIKFTSHVVYTGSTSLTVHVEVSDEMTGQSAAEGFLTFVTVDKATGKKRTHGIRLDETDDPRELALRQEAKVLRSIQI